MADWRKSQFTRHHNLLTSAVPITGPIVKNGGGRTAGKKVGRTVGGGGGDPDFASVVLLLGMEGADASTTFTDESAALRGNATVFGNTQIDTAQFKFGAASGLFDGTGDNLTYPNSIDWDFGSGPFTVDAWVRHNSLTAPFHYFGNRDSATGWRMLYSSGELRFTIGSAGNAAAAWTPTIGQWYHIAADREASGGILRIYIDGVMANKQAATGTVVADSTKALHIGVYTSAIQYFNGWMDELRITKGVARYASDAGFTVPTAAYPRS